MAGVKTEQEFYRKYPNEKDFFEAHPDALKKLARGGEAYPQTATMDNFFSYGVPVPPTYYAHGGAFPMAQSEEQFFSPFYGNVPNPYNKAMGGSSEAYPQSMSFPYGNTGRSTHFMMEDGGDMPEEQTLPKMGVNGKLLEFVGTVKNTAANKLNSNLAKYGKVKNPEQYEFEKAKWGGNLKEYQTKETAGGIDDVELVAKKGPIFEPLNLPKVDTNSDVPGTANYYGEYSQGYGSPSFTNCFPGNPNCNQVYGQLPPEYYNDIDYLRGRRRPYRDFDIRGKGMFGKYRSTGWLKDEYGLEGLRQMGMTDMQESNPKWWQLLKRPTKTYIFDRQYQQQGPNGEYKYNPVKIYDKDGMPDHKAQNAYENMLKPGNEKDMGFFARMFHKSGNVTGQGRDVMPGTPSDPNAEMSPQMTSAFDYKGYNPNYSEARNQIFQNKRQKIGKQLDKLYQKRADMEDMGLTISDKDERKMKRLGNRFNRKGTGKGVNYSFDTYEEPTPAPGFAYGGYTTYAKGGSYNAGDVVDMTPEELQRFIEMGGQVEFLD